METTSFQTSFIPKQPITENKTDRASSGSVGIFVFISIILLIASIVSAGLVYVYKITLEKSIKQSETELVKAKDVFETDFISELKNVDRRLKAADDIIQNHLVLSSVFEMLQKTTLKTVRFNKFTHNVTGTGKNSKIEIKMTGKARDYTSIALQSDALTKSKYVHDPLFSNLTLDEQGNVSFELSFSVDPELVLFSNVLVRSDAEDTNNETLPVNDTSSEVTQ